MPGMAKTRPGYGLQIEMLAGANADTNIAVANILTTDEIIACFHITTTAAIATMVNITSEVVILSDGNIQLTTTATGSDSLFLFWNRLDM